MKGFRFRLQSLLNLRMQQRDQVRISVADATRAIQILEQQVAEKDQAMAELKQGRIDQLRGTVSVERLLADGRYELVFEQEKASLLEQIVQVGKELDKRRQALQVADQEVKRIEKLRENALLAYQQQQQSRMQAEMDEAAAVMNRFGNK